MLKCFRVFTTNLAACSGKKLLHWYIIGPCGGHHVDAPPHPKGAIVVLEA